VCSSDLPKTPKPLIILISREIRILFIIDN